jgi:hypothetical protein
MVVDCVPDLVELLDARKKVNSVRLVDSIVVCNRTSRPEDLGTKNDGTISFNRWIALSPALFGFAVRAIL